MDGKRAIVTIGGITYSMDPKAVVVREPTDMVFCPKPRRSELHPTMKPPALWRYLIENSSDFGDVVLDPFGGSGTTIVTAEATGRKARSAELDPHYCDVIRKRWSDFAVGKDADWQKETPEEGGDK
jgi:DNA modification methylase